MPTENEIVITTPDGPSDAVAGTFSRRVKWNRLKGIRATGSHLIVYFEQGRFDRNQIDGLNKIKEKIKLLLLQFKKEETNILFNEIASRLSHSIIKRTIAFYKPEVLNRVISAIGLGAEHNLISDAYVVDNTLIVIDCAAKRFEIGAKHLKSISKNGIVSNNFEIQHDGSHLYWPEFDYHIDIEGLRSKIDEAFRKNLSLKYLQENQRLGIAIRKLREEMNLKQSDILDISDRQLRRIEAGESVPSFATIEALSKYHQLNIDEYVRKLSSYAS